MKRLNKIAIAKEYIALHKDNNVDDWSARFQAFDMAEDDKYAHIYDRLMDNDYGEVRHDAEWSEDDVLIKPATKFEIEISRFDSKTGNPVIFEWEEN